MKNRDGGAVNDDWGTPKQLYDKLDSEFHFDFDPCPLNHTVDGLSPVTKWGKSNFINPPYNRVDKPRFIKRAFEEYQKGCVCVLLIPAATGTKQFHELILPHSEIRFLKGRIAFTGTNTKGERVTTKKGKHDSMIVIFRPTLSQNKGEQMKTDKTGLCKLVEIMEMEEENGVYPYLNGSWAYKLLAKARTLLADEKSAMEKAQGQQDGVRENFQLLLDILEQGVPNPPKHLCGPDSNCDGDCVDWSRFCDLIQKCKNSLSHHPQSVEAQKPINPVVAAHDKGKENK